MSKFKVGDRVRVIATNIGTDAGGTGRIIKIDGSSNFPYYISYDDIDDLKLYSKVEKIGGSNMYDDLKQQIEDLDGDSSLKEWDDLLQEIDKNLTHKIENICALELALTIKLKDTSGNYMVFIARNWGNKNEEASPLFKFGSQCQKLEALKKACLWLLDHFDIPKVDKEKQNKIEQLEQKLDEIKEELEGLK